LETKRKTGEERSYLTLLEDDQPMPRRWGEWARAARAGQMREA
jgi:hypothetical protein